MQNNLAGYTYEFVQRTGPRTLLLLHGTGGSEGGMLTLGEQLDPAAHLLSLRGNVTENGMLRFFKRHAEGLLDREDLMVRTEELAAFITAATVEHGFALADIVGVGFSNGANILLHFLCVHPHLLKAMLLFRPMSAALADSVGNLDGLPVFICAGQHDEMIPDSDAKRLESVLMSAGAKTTLRITPHGHGLALDDIALAKEWLATLD